MLNFSVDTYLNTFHLEVGFQAEAGKTTVLLGESGAGKSTVLRLLVGLLHPKRGHIVLDGVTYFDDERNVCVPPQERPFGYVFQEYVLFPHLSVFENVAFGLRAQRMAGRLVRGRVEEALAQVHMVGMEQRRPEQLSGGQQQRVALARALALQPQLLLLDEPLSALDVQTRREVRQELRAMLAELGLTTVLVTHNYLDALLFADQILVLDQGRVIQQGGQRELREYPRSSYVAELVGVNFFRGRIKSLEANTMCVIELPTGARSVEIVARLREQGSGEALPKESAEAYVVVAPRSITLHEAEPEGSARNVLAAEIVHLLPLNATVGEANEGVVRVSMLLTDGITPLTAEITENSARRMRLREGQRVYATFKATEASAYV